MGRADLARKFSPVIFQETDRLPLYDALTSVDFDGNFNGYDNVNNVETHPLPAHIYGDVIAETEDSYYLLYIFYHPKDYDTKLREFFFSAASHDNDLEGAMIVVDKKSQTVIAVETWFHNLFLQFAYSNQSKGEQTIDGKIHLEDESHLLLYIDSKGHGVRAFQKIDEGKINSKQFLIYRIGNVADDIKTAQTQFINYTILDFKTFLNQAKGPFGRGHLFEDPSDFGFGEKIGKYMSGHYNGKNGWARPKPPWSWADKFESLRNGAWFFHPAYVIQYHFGLPLSQNYTFNWSCENLMSCNSDSLNAWAQEKKDKSFFAGKKLNFLEKWLAKISKQIYKWIEYLFYKFG